MWVCSLVLWKLIARSTVATTVAASATVAVQPLLTFALRGALLARNQQRGVPLGGGVRGLLLFGRHFVAATMAAVALGELLPLARAYDRRRAGFGFVWGGLLVCVGELLIRAMGFRLIQCAI